MAPAAPRSMTYGPVVHGASSNQATRLAASTATTSPPVCLPPSRAPLAGARVLNFTDDTPAESEAVVTEAARLLGVKPPPAVPFEAAYAEMSDMARSFWAENRRVSCAATKAVLGIGWKYPSYRDGLAAILAEERRNGPQ